MTIKGTKTIAQYKLMRWINENFLEDSIKVEFTGDDTAVIFDSCGDTMKLKYEQGEVKVIE